MKLNKSFIVLATVIFLCGCLGTSNQSLPDLTGWTLLKKHKVTTDDSLYRAFGPITYEVYANSVVVNSRTGVASLPIDSTYAILVYPEADNAAKPLLTGFLHKIDGDMQKVTWQLSAYDKNQQLLPADQISTNCLPCHTKTDDRVILGRY